jgi:hypothetical protein
VGFEGQRENYPVDIHIAMVMTLFWLVQAPGRRQLGVDRPQTPGVSFRGGCGREGRADEGVKIMPNRRSIVAVVAATALILFVAACGGSSHIPPPVSTNAESTSTTQVGGTVTTVVTPTTTAATASCNLPLTHDTYSGFHIAVPAGWTVSTLNGEIQVAKDPQATEAVVVYPALQTSSLTPAGFFSSYLGQLQQQAQNAGHAITATPEASRNGFPVDSLSGTEGSAPVTGEATVSRLPFQTSGASSELVFIAYWAPSAALPADAPLLSSIASCYGPERGSLSQVFRDPAFTYILPPGWVVGSESQNTLDLHLGTTADVSYLFAEAIPASQVSSAQGLIDFFLGQEGFRGVESLSALAPPSQQTTEYEDFTGTLNGLSDHGLIYASITPTGSVTSGTVRLALSTADQWNSLNSGMIQMAGAIQHDFTQDLQQLQQVMHQFQNFSGQVEDFDDVLNNQQLVQDPSNGKLYEAPYAAYTDDGPGGPGYYLPNGHRLNEIQRS